MNVRISLAFSFLDRYLSLAVGIASTVILARLLTPAELGVFSVCMALVSVASTVRDLGAGNYLLQEKDLTTDRIKAVWAIQLGLGAFLGLLVAAASEISARFYGEPTVRWIMLLLAVNFVVNPFGSLTYAALMRDMRYRDIAVMRFASTLAGAATSVGMAWLGYGAAGLAVGSLTATSVNALVSLRYRPSDYPWMPSFREGRRVLAFGVRLSGVSILNTAVTASPEFFVAKTLGMTSVGHYSRANGLVAMFNRLVNDAVYSVALSLFAKEARQGNTYAQPFLRAIAYLCVLSWSFCAALALLAYPAIHLLYGDQWLQSVVLTRWLAAAAALGAPVPLCIAALIGGGHIASLTRVTLVSAASNLCAVAVGSTLSLPSVGVGLTVAAAFNLGFWLHATRRVVRYSLSALVKAVSLSACVAIASSLGPFLSVAIFGLAPQSSVLPLAVAAVGGLIGFIVAAIALDHPFGAELRRLWAAVCRWRGDHSGREDA